MLLHHKRNLSNRASHKAILVFPYTLDSDKRHDICWKSELSISQKYVGCRIILTSYEQEVKQP